MLCQDKIWYFCMPHVMSAFTVVMQCHGTVVGYCNFWGNHCGAAAFGLCTSTGTWGNTGGRAPWDPGGHPLHIPTLSFHKVISLKILPKRKTKSKNILTDHLGPKPDGFERIRNLPRIIMPTWDPVVDDCWLCKLLRGNSSIKSSHVSAGKAEHTRPSMYPKCSYLAAGNECSAFPAAK